MRLTFALSFFSTCMLDVDFCVAQNEYFQSKYSFSHKKRDEFFLIWISGFSRIIRPRILGEFSRKEGLYWKVLKSFLHLTVTWQLVNTFGYLFWPRSFNLHSCRSYLLNLILFYTQRRWYFFQYFLIPQNNREINNFLSFLIYATFRDFYFLFFE